jgi:hypothetical protein
MEFAFTTEMIGTSRPIGNLRPFAVEQWQSLLPAVVPGPYRQVEAEILEVLIRTEDLKDTNHRCSVQDTVLAARFGNE